MPAGTFQDTWPHLIFLFFTPFILLCATSITTLAFLLFTYLNKWNKWRCFTNLLGYRQSRISKPWIWRWTFHLYRCRPCSMLTYSPFHFSFFHPVQWCYSILVLQETVTYSSTLHWKQNNGSPPRCLQNRPFTYLPSIYWYLSSRPYSDQWRQSRHHQTRLHQPPHWHCLSSCC